MCVKLFQSCPTLCHPMDKTPPGSSVHGNSPGKNTGVGCKNHKTQNPPPAILRFYELIHPDKRINLVLLFFFLIFYMSIGFPVSPNHFRLLFLPSSHTGLNERVLSILTIHWGHWVKFSSCYLFQLSTIKKVPP